MFCKAAKEIELLRKQLFEAHAGNSDSERLDWLSEQAHDEYLPSVATFPCTALYWPVLRRQSWAVHAMKSPRAVSRVVAMQAAAADRLSARSGQKKPTAVRSAKRLQPIGGHAGT
jgi:hypothetical protein